MRASVIEFALRRSEFKFKSSKSDNAICGQLFLRQFPAIYHRSLPSIVCRSRAIQTSRVTRPFPPSSRRQSLCQCCQRRAIRVKRFMAGFIRFAGSFEIQRRRHTLYLPQIVEWKIRGLKEEGTGAKGVRAGRLNIELAKSSIPRSPWFL